MEGGRPTGDREEEALLPGSRSPSQGCFSAFNVFELQKKYSPTVRNPYNIKVYKARNNILLPLF